MSNRNILISIFLLALILRLINIGKYGNNDDEHISRLIANGIYKRPALPEVFTTTDLKQENNLSAVAASTVSDNGNCLTFNVLLHYWLLITVNNDMTGRYLSLLFGLMMLPVAWRFSLLLFNDKKVALFTTFLFAIHPLFVECSQLSRSYIFGIFSSLCSSYAFYKIISRQATVKIYIIYAVTAALSLLAHYLTITVFLAHGLIFLTYVRDRRTVINYIIAGSVACLLFGAWIFGGGLKGMEVMDAQNVNYATLAANYKEGDNPFHVPATPKNIVTGWIQIWLPVFGNSFQEFGLRIREIAILILLPASLIVLLFRSVKNDHETRKKIYFLLILTFVQTGFATLLAIKSGHCISFQTIYSSFITPYAVLLMGFTMMILIRNVTTKKVATGITASILLIMIISLIPGYHNLNKPSAYLGMHKNAAAVIMQTYQSENIVHVQTDKDAKIISLYLDDKTYKMQVDTALTKLFEVK